MNGFLGEDVFLNGLRSYLKQHIYGQRSFVSLGTSLRLIRAALCVRSGSLCVMPPLASVARLSQSLMDYLRAGNALTSDLWDAMTAAAKAKDPSSTIGPHGASLPIACRGHFEPMLWLFRL